MHHYAPKTFLRQTSNRLLCQFFADQNALLDLPWNELQEQDADIIYNAWQALPAEKRIAIEKRFEDVQDLADREGAQAIIEEGQFHHIDLAPELDSLEGYRDKALYVSMQYPQVFDVAGVIHRAHNLPQRYWRHRGGLPRVEPDVSQQAIDEFASAIGSYYQVRQGRGHYCSVDPYLRINRFHYFFAYPDDYADTYLGHDENGEFVRRPHKPAFEVVFIFDPEEGVLNLYAQGGKRVHEALQSIFCRCLLGRCLPTEGPLEHSYELNQLKSRDFGFPTDPEDGIVAVRVRKLRLALLFGSLRRITLEVDASSELGAIYDMMENFLNREKLPETLFNVTQATLSLEFASEEKKKPRSLTFDVTYPNSSNLQSKREELRVIAEKYLKRWKIDRA